MKYTESAIINFVMLVSNKVNGSYRNSQIYRIIYIISSYIKTLFSNSVIWRFIIRKDYFSKVMANGLIIRSIEALINAPANFFHNIFEKFEGQLSNSKVFALIKVILGKYEVIIAGFLAIALLLPHSRWDNMYSTIIVMGLALLYFLKIVLFKNERFSLSGLDFAFILFVLTVIMSTITSIYPKDSLRTFAFYITCFVFVILFVNSINSKKQLEIIIDIILVCISLSGIYGIYQAKVLGIQPDASLTDLSTNLGLPGRVFSTMGNPNNYGEILVLTLPFFFAAFLNAKTKLKKLIYLCLLVPPLAGFALTSSRSSFLGFAFAIFVFLFFKNFKLIPFAALLGVLSIPFLPGWLYNRILTIFNPTNDSSFNYRGLIFKSILPMIKEFWFTGLGLGSIPFMKVVPQHYLYVDATPAHSHDLYLQIMLEGGIVAILTFLWFIIRIIKKSMLIIYNSKDTYINHILMSGLAALAGILLVGLVEYIWFYPRVMLFFWVNIGIILASLKLNTTRSSI